MCVCLSFVFLIYWTNICRYSCMQSSLTLCNCFPSISFSLPQQTIQSDHRQLLFATLFLSFSFSINNWRRSSMFFFCHPLSYFLLAIVVVALFLLAALVRCRRSGSDVIYVNCLRDISIENPYYEPVRTPLRINCNTLLCYKQQQQSEWWSDKELPRRLRSISFHDGHNQSKFTE